MNALGKLIAAPTLAGLLLVGCDDPFGVAPGELPLVQTRETFTVSPGATPSQVFIPFQFVNATDRVLYARFACKVIVERKDTDDGWVHHWGGRECLAALENASYLAPGERHRGEIRPRVDSTWTPGEYRLRLDALSSELSGGEGGVLGSNIPLKFRVSNVFLVESSE
jgi:hypothetical protein